MNITTDRPEPGLEISDMRRDGCVVETGCSNSAGACVDVCALMAVGLVVSTPRLGEQSAAIDLGVDPTICTVTEAIGLRMERG